MNFASAPDAKLTREQRVQVIIAAGVTLANESGLTTCRPIRVAERCSHVTSVHTVRKYFWRNEDLWREIARHPNANPQVIREARALGL